MPSLRRPLALASLLLILIAGQAAPAAAQSQQPEAESATFSENEIVKKTEDFFGGASEGLAKAIAKVFREQGRPNAYIAGEEVSGAVGIGARYGEGSLQMKTGAARKVYWQGPSIGFDLGADASKVFVLVYNLPTVDAVFQRFPAVDGSLYFIAGVGVNYQKSGDIIQAPIRTGVGLRAGINVGYMHYTRKFSWIPL